MAEKTKVLNLRLSEEEYEAFKKAADESGLSLSAWIRQACRARAKLPTA